MIKLTPVVTGNVLSLGDTPSNATISAPNPIEQYRAVIMAQTTAGVTLTLPAPTAAGKVAALDLINAGTASITVSGAVVPAGMSARIACDSAAMWRALSASGTSATTTPSVYWSPYRVPQSGALYSDAAMTTLVDPATVATGAIAISATDYQTFYKAASGTFVKSSANSIAIPNGDSGSLDFGRIVYLTRGIVSGYSQTVCLPVWSGIASGVLQAGPVIACVDDPYDMGTSGADQIATSGQTVRASLTSPRKLVRINGVGVAGDTIYLQTNGQFTTSRPTGAAYYEIGQVLSGPFSDGTTLMYFFPRFYAGASTVSGSVVDNTIVDSKLIDTVGRYIVPHASATAPVVTLLNAFAGHSDQYVDWSGAIDTTDPLNPAPTGFTFTAPSDGDTVMVTTGPNAGQVWGYTTAGGWAKQTQTTGLPTFNYDPTVAYPAGDLVIRNQALYQANANIPANTPFALGTTGATWKQIGISGAAEYGEVTLSATVALPAANNGPTNAVDVLTIAIPSAGTWEIIPTVRSVSSGTGTSGASFALYDASNTLIAGTEGKSSYINAATGIQGVGARVWRVVTTGAATYKLRAWCDGGAASVLSDNNGRTSVAWKKIAGYMPVGNIAEFGSSLSIPDGATFTSTLKDITGAGFTLPSAGTWLVEYTLHATMSGPNQGNVRIRNSLNVAVPGSQASFVPVVAGAGSGVMTGGAIINTNGSEDFKLSGITDTATVSIRNNQNTNNGGNSWIRWTKLAGLLPVTGQTVDYLQVRRAGSTQTLNANTDIIFDAVVSGNIPYNTTTGVISLTAGKGYRFTASLSTNSMTSYLVYNLVDATTNAAISPGAGLVPATYTGGEYDAPLDFVYTPTSNQNVKLRVTQAGAVAVLRNDVLASLIVQQVGTSNQIGAPANAPLLGTDNSGNFAARSASGMVAASTPITFDTIKARIVTSNGNGLQLASATGATIVAVVSGWASAGGTPTMIAAQANGANITTTFACPFAWTTVNQAGNAFRVLVNDTTNSRVYEVTGMIGATTHALEIRRVV